MNGKQDYPLRTWVDETVQINKRHFQNGHQRIAAYWGFRTDMIAVYLTNKHRDHPGKWVVDAYNIASVYATDQIFETVLDLNIDAALEVAQAAALELAKSHLQKMVDSI